MLEPSDLPFRVRSVVSLNPLGWALFVEVDPMDEQLRVRLVHGEGHHQEIVVWFGTGAQDEPTNKWEIEAEVWPRVIAHITDHIVNGRPLSDDHCTWDWDHG